MYKLSVQSTLSSFLTFFPYQTQDSEPHQLHLVNITRKGGVIGKVVINISVVYQLPGSSSPSNEVMLTYPSVVTIDAGSRSASVAVQITNNGFIKLGAAFKAELIAVSLQRGGKNSFETPVLPGSWIAAGKPGTKGKGTGKQNYILQDTLIFHLSQVQVTVLLTYKHIGQCPLAY